MIEKTNKSHKHYVEKLIAVDESMCNRCYGKDVTVDSHNNIFCLECFKYGILSSNNFIYRYNRKILSVKHKLNIKYKLSDTQKIGSDFILNCLTEKKLGFLQAVCGAGKTEMTYQAILNSVNQNLRVCFVIPRVEVLKQVYTRIKEHFPKTCVKILFEQNKDFDMANIIISTPQQLIYFYKEFDLLIIDEVDAYPLKDNKFLFRLINKSISDTGTIIYMSATITDSFINQIQNKKIKYCLIPKRYHKRKLIVPKFLKYRSKSNYEELFNLLNNQKVLNRKILLYVPTIAKARKYYEVLSSKFTSEYITSKSKNKKEIIKNFAKNNYYVLITTTILERGVTFDDIDVIVVEADHKVFLKGTLIQIAGRVGRNQIDDDGDVYFLSKYKTKAMIQAQKEIIKMNRYKRNEV